MDLRLNDKLAIAEVVNNWAIWRDAGDWDRFRTVWHADGWMTATWFQGPAEKFIEVSRAGFEKGVSILHFLGGTSVEVKGERGIAQTKMTISQRGAVDGVVVDVVCTGRFYDFFAQARRPLGDRAAPADLREGPDGPGEPEREARARRSAPRAVPRGLPPPRLPPDEARVHDQARPAAAQRGRSSPNCTRTAGRGSTACRRRFPRPDLQNGARAPVGAGRMMAASLASSTRQHAHDPLALAGRARRPRNARVCRDRADRRGRTGRGPRGERADRPCHRRLRPPRAREGRPAQGGARGPPHGHARRARHLDARDHQGHPRLGGPGGRVRRAERRARGERGHLHPLRSHVAAMAPATNLGAATPVAIGMPAAARRRGAAIEGQGRLPTTRPEHRRTR